MKRPLALLLLAAILLPGMTVGLISWRAYEHTLENARIDRQQQARSLREHMMRVFEAQSLAIELIDTELGDATWSDVPAIPRLTAVIERIIQRSPHIESVWLIDPTGRVVAGAGPAAGNNGGLAVGADIASKPYFKALRQGATSYLTVDASEGADQTVSFNLAQPRTVGGVGGVGGAFDGVIIVTIQLSYFEQFWREARLSNNGVVTLLRTDGELIARYPKLSDRMPLRLPPHSSFFSAQQENPEQGDYRFNSIVDGVDRLYSYVRIPNIDSYLVVGTDRAAVLANWRQDTLTLSVIALALTLALVAATLQVMRRGGALADANRRLTLITQDLAAEVTRRRAVESTLVAREEHEAALRRANEELRAGEERFRLLFETLTQGVVIHDAAGHIQSANAAAEQILGLSLAEMVGAGLDWGAVDVEGQRIGEAGFPVIQALNSGRVVHGLMMGVYNPAKSERRWLVVDAVPVIRPGEVKPSGAYAVFSDVTERRRGEQAQRLLIREVDHRAKNALAVVQAVIRLTKAETPQRFVEVVEGRVTALAHAHTILAMNRWEGALLYRLVQVELEAYGGGDGDRVQINGPDITVRPEAAQPISMVLHELTTNAAKHGALAQPDGRLSVRWAVVHGGDAIQLDWQETGGPALVNGPARRGFGSTMIEASMRQQLQGSICYDWTDDGLHATIRFPADQLAPLDALTKNASPETPVDTEALPPEPAGQTGPRILLVEDNVPLGQLFREMLEALDYAVIGPYTNVPAALAAARGQQIDVAMLDIEMNGAQVFPVAEALRHRGIPILFCTGYSDVWEPEWADVPILRKPVTLPALRDRLAALLPGA